MTYLAVPISASNLDGARQQIKAARTAGAEILELRTDYLENLTVDLVKKLIAEAKNATGQSVPIIVTCRDQKQGGARAYPQQLRIGILAEAARSGCDFIDCEYDNFRSAEVQNKIKAVLAESSKTRLILSAHDFKSRFEDIDRLYQDILKDCPNAIPKLVYTANHINDCFDAFDLLHRTSGDRIVFCMGEAGLSSRIIAKKLGSFVTFASISEEAATAPGQLTIEQFKGLYRYDSIDSDTELFGVIADPVGHSLSPAIHNACFADAGMNKLYLPLLVEGGQKEFDEFLNNVLAREWLNFKGFSVTIPHKENALNYVKTKNGFIEPLADKIGAVNTLIFGMDGKLSAYNTDYAAALDAITSTMGITRADLKGLPVAVIGAGGVARAIVAGLSDVGARIKIYNRTLEKAERLADEFNCDYASLDDLPNVDAKLLINCTSIGMKKTGDRRQETGDRRQETEDRRQKTEGQRLKTNYEPRITSHDTPVPQEYLKRDMVVFDTVYNPAETLLLKQAKEAGAKTIDGISMFVNQALAQFKLFTKQDAAGELMRKSVEFELHK
jgi:3-dehydroquinate dehydratase/shikimate dehydrogenase